MAAVVADRASGGLGLAAALGLIRCNQGERTDLIMICQLGKGAGKGTSEHNFVKTTGEDDA